MPEPIGKIVKELTRESYTPDRYSSFCADCARCGPSEPVTSDSPDYLHGWWKRHILGTGHRVIIEERGG